MNNQETLEGQIRNALQGAVVKAVEVGREPYPIRLILISRFSKSNFTLLHITEGNVKYRRPKDKSDLHYNATWTIRDDRAADLLRLADAVAVSYGPAAEDGEIWHNSSGNNRKGSYRRFALREDVTPITDDPQLVGAYKELPYTFTEINLRLVWSGKPLKTISDHAAYYGTSSDYSDSRHVG